MKRVLAIAAVAMMAAAPQFSLADHGGYRGGGYHGGGASWWWIVPPLVYLSTLPAYQQPVYPDPVIVESPPQTVIVQPPAMPAGPQAGMAAPQSYWYYCEANKGYYPYVSTCPSDWRMVPAQPPGVAR